MVALFPCYKPTGTGNTFTELEGNILKIIPEQSASSALFSNPSHFLRVSKTLYCSTNQNHIDK